MNIEQNWIMIGLFLSYDIKMKEMIVKDNECCSKQKGDKMPTQRKVLFTRRSLYFHRILTVSKESEKCKTAHAKLKDLRIRGRQDYWGFIEMHGLSKCEKLFTFQLFFKLQHIFNLNLNFNQFLVFIFLFIVSCIRLQKHRYIERD